MAHTFNPRSWETEAFEFEASLGDSEFHPGQDRLQSYTENPCLKTKSLFWKCDSAMFAHKESGSLGCEALQGAPGVNTDRPV